MYELRLARGMRADASSIVRLGTNGDSVLRRHYERAGSMRGDDALRRHYERGWVEDDDWAIAHCHHLRMADG